MSSIQEPAPHLQLHLGCGKRYIPGFIHVDLDNFPHIDYRCGIDKLPMFRDETVGLIYCSHGFPYFDREQAVEVLREWWRLLKSGGVLRLAVTDFDALISVYQATGEIGQILGPLFGRIVVQTSDGNDVLYQRTTYNYRSLKALLEKMNFRNIRRYEWQNTIHREYDDFSQAYKLRTTTDPGLLISLNVEAVR